MIDPDRNVIAAYRRAWRTGRELDDADVRLLHGELDAALQGVDEEVRAEIEELLVSCWDRGVPPWRLHLEVARHAVRSLSSPWAMIARSAHGSNAWMDFPGGVEPLSFDPEGTLTELDLALWPEADEVLSDARDAPADSTGWHLAPVWLRPAGSAGTLEVLIGHRPVGHVSVSHLMWQQLRQEAGEGRFASGELGVRGTVAGDVEVGRVHCVLPKVAP